MKKTLFALTFAITQSVTCLPVFANETQNFKSWLNQDYSYLLKLYKELHQSPEISFQEVNTAKKIASELDSLGYQVTTNFGGHGVVGLLKNGNGPVVLIRTDLDGLPIKEETNLEYASSHQMADRDGNQTYTMHACGHDIHMSVFVGTARYLAKHKEQWQGTMVMIGQPAEERSGGAKAMLKDGLFEKFPRPDYNLALHVSSDKLAGTVGAVKGYAMANVDSVDLTVLGEGGHGAYPNTTKDPIVLSAQIISALQTVVSREISPLEPAVITVGSIHGGSQHNIIPNSVKMQLTLRSYSKQVRDQIIEAIKRISANLARAAGIPEDKLPIVDLLDEFTPAAYNNPELSQKVLTRFEQAFGSERVFNLTPEMVGEDFGRYGQVNPAIPSLMFRLGTVSKEKYEQYQQGKLRLPSLHSAQYAPDPEPSIKTGVEAMTSAAIMLLSKQ